MSQTFAYTYLHGNGSKPLVIIPSQICIFLRSTDFHNIAYWSLLKAFHSSHHLLINNYMGIEPPTLSLDIREPLGRPDNHKNYEIAREVNPMLAL